MPRFFIPAARDDAMAEEVLAATAKFVGRPVPPPAERIFRFGFEHNGRLYKAQVGDEIDSYYQSPGPVIAIFGGNPLLICMRDRGVARGGPIMVSAHAVIDGSVEYFDDEPGKSDTARTLITPSLNGVPSRSLSLSATDVERALANGDEAATGGLTRDGAVKDAIGRMKSGSEHPIICEGLLWAACQREAGIVELAVAGGVEIKMDITERDGDHFDCRYEVLERAR